MKNRAIFNQMIEDNAEKYLNVHRQSTDFEMHLGDTIVHVVKGKGHFKASYWDEKEFNHVFTIKK